MFPRRGSHWLEKQTSRVRDFSLLHASVIPKPFCCSYIHSLKGAVRAHTLCPYLQPFAFTYPCKHHSHPAFILRNCIQEPALLCEPAKNLRDAGKSIAAGFTVALGRITGPDWYTKVRRFNLPITSILTNAVLYHRNGQISNKADRKQSPPPPPPPPPPKINFPVYRRHLL